MTQRKNNRRTCTWHHWRLRVIHAHCLSASEHRRAKEKAGVQCPVPHRKWTLPTFPTASTDPGQKKTTVAYEDSGHTLTCSGTQPIKPQGSRNQRPEFPNFILKYLGSSTPEATGCPISKQKQ